MAAPVREYRYQVDRDGRIFHDGTEVVDPLTLRFFLHAMTRTDDGRFLVRCQGEENWFEAHETPFVVQRLRVTLEGGGLAAALLCLQGDYREPLDPAGLESTDGLLFCRVRRGVFRARFGRVATQQLAPFLVDGAAGPALAMRGTCYPIANR